MMMHLKMMKKKYEVIHWPHGGRIHLCQTKGVAENLAKLGAIRPGIHGHIVREVWFTDDGEHYGKPYKEAKEKHGIHSQKMDNSDSASGILHSRLPTSSERIHVADRRSTTRLSKN